MVGPPYAVALRLYAIAVARWSEIDSAYATLNIIHERPDRFCGLVYGWCVKWMNQEQREQFDYKLFAPLPGREGAEPVPEIAEMEGQSFMTAMMQHQMVTGQAG